MGVESDDTVRLRVPRRGAPRRVMPWVLAAALGVFVSAGGTWWSLRPAPTLAPSADASAPPPPAQVQPETPQTAEPQAPPPATALATTDEPKPAYEQLNTSARAQLAFAPPPTVTPPPPYAPALANEADILADSPSQLAVYRFASQPAVIVLQFPSLAEQALMLNRVAALVEKSGFPHEQVLPRAELNARIVAGGATPDDFYYGHDYRSADLVRFFGLAKDLDAEEQDLQVLVHKLGWDEKGAVGALVTLVRQSEGTAGLDPSARAAILRHELSHGVYFTNPDYAAYCAHFWRDILTPEERAKFVAFLDREGYDTAFPDLMINETQAYLMHTPDRRFFSPAEVGISQQRVAELRQIFLVGMPPSWLRDRTTADKLP